MTLKASALMGLFLISAAGLLCPLSFSQQSAAAAAKAEPAAPECLKCHSAIGAAMAKKVKHAAMEGGCESCHVNHRDKKAAAEAKGEHYLQDKQPAVCGMCHDAADQKIAAAHKGQPFAQSECSGCHNPHGSDQPKLMAEQAHGPFGARECDSCHKAPKDGKVVLTEASVSALCFGCHADVEEKYRKSKFQHTLMKSDENSCTDCHDPHATNQKFGLRRPVTRLCSTCHADLTEGKKFVHQPVGESCTICHEAHGGRFGKQLRAEGNAACNDCHDYRANPAKKDGGARVVLGAVEVPEDLVKGARKILVDSAGKGHPLIGHPTAGAGDRSSGGKARMTCLSCHQPHAGAHRQMYVQDQRGQALCDRCHAK